MMAHACNPNWEADTLRQAWDAHRVPGKRGSHRKTLTQTGCGINEVAEGLKTAPGTGTRQEGQVPLVFHRATLGFKQASV